MLSHTIGLRSILQKNGFSFTKQRLLVFDLLLHQEPMTVYELIDRAAGRLDRASIYRTLSVYEQIGVVRQINIGWKYKVELSDIFAEHHHHLTCLRCGRIIPIGSNELEKFITQLANEYNFSISEHQIELQGYCRACFPK